MKGKVPRRPWFPFALASTLTGMANVPATAQGNRDPGELGTPYPLYNRPEPAPYNLKWGKLLARFNAAVVSEFSDNLDLADRDPKADFSLGPNFGVGFLWPISKANLLQLDLSAGYRWFVNHPALHTVNIAPNSRVDYRVLFDHGQLSLHDTFSVQVDPVSRPDVSGGAGLGDVLNFRRLSNTAGVTGEWRPVKRWSLVAGYDFTLDRSLTGAFTSIDRDDHTFSAGTYYSFSPRLTAGLSGASTLTYYVQGVQNDATSYTVGPVVVFQPSPFITVDLRGGYAVTEFDPSGTITDTSEFHGATGRLGLSHTLNRWMTHEVRLNRSVALGLGSNYYDLLGVQYSLSARLNRFTTLRTGVQFEHYRTSGPASESADRFTAHLRATWQVARRWELGAGYAFSRKESDRLGFDYTQNRFTLDLTRHF